MPRYGALFAPWPWTPDGYTGMTYMERERVDKVRQGLRTVFDEGSAYVVEQAVLKPATTYGKSCMAGKSEAL